MQSVDSAAMASTTIRVDAETHEMLRELSREAGATLVDTVRQAAEALWQRRSLKTVAAQMAALRADPVAWAEYLAEAEATHVTDGID